MKILTFTLTLLFINIALFSQQFIPTKKLDINKFEIKKGIAFEKPVKKDINPYIAKPDSMVTSHDSLGLTPFKVSHYSYYKNKVTIQSKEIPTGKESWLNTNLYEYYFGEDTLKLPYEYLLNFPTIIDESKGDYFQYTRSIGDTMSIKHIWDTLKNAWIEQYKTTHSINNLGICEESVIYVWDTVTKEYTYNFTVIQELTHKKTDSIKVTMKEGDSLIYSTLNSFDYYDQEKIVKAKDSSIYTSSSDSIVYDDKGRVIIEFNQFFYDYYHLKLVNSYDEYDRLTKSHYFRLNSTTGIWDYDISRLYFYSYIPPSSVSEYEKNNDEYTVFPNPVTEYLQIKDYEGSLLIINITGKTVLNRTVSRNEKVYIGDLEKGCYILTFNGNRYRKIIKE